MSHLVPKASTLLIEIPEQNHEMPVGDPGHGPKRKRNDADLEEERKQKKGQNDKF